MNKLHKIQITLVSVVIIAVIFTFVWQLKSMINPFGEITTYNDDQAINKTNELNDLTQIDDNTILEDQQSTIDEINTNINSQQTFSVVDFFDTSDIDYTDAIIRAQETINEEESGGILFFPKGNYLIRPSKIFISSNTTWLGETGSRIYTEETEAYNIMVSTDKLTTNIIIKNLIFDQSGDLNILPDGNNYKGCYILFGDNTNNLSVVDCTFYSYGICAVLTQSYIETGSELITILNNKAIFSRQVEKLYDVSLFNIDAGKVNFQNNYAESINENQYKYWKARTGFEIHSQNATIINNQSTNNEVGIIHLAWPSMWDKYIVDDETVSNISYNTIDSCIIGISLWGDSSGLGIETSNVSVNNNSIVLKLEKDYIPAYGISLENGDYGNARFNNISLIENDITFIVDKQITSIDKEMEKLLPGNGTGAFLLNTNNIIENLSILDNTIIDFPFSFVNLELQNADGERHKFVNIKGNHIVDSAYIKTHDQEYQNLISIQDVEKLIVENNDIRFNHEPNFPLIAIGDSLLDISIILNNIETPDNEYYISFKDLDILEGISFDLEYEILSDNLAIIKE